MTLESTIEAYFVKRIIELGGFSLKTDRVQGKRFLDRTAFLPGGRVIVAELKRPVGGRKAALQKEHVKQLISTQHEAAFIKTKAEVDIVLYGKFVFAFGRLIYVHPEYPPMMSTVDGLQEISVAS